MRCLTMDMFYVKLDMKSSCKINRPLRKFCVSDFRQKQEYHMYAVHDEACSPCLPLSREDGTVCAPLAA